MNMEEFNKVKDLTYVQYCDYLQGKYGIGICDYMTSAYSPKPKCKRTKEGLFVHHKDEDKMIMLSKKEYAEKFPFEWQTKEHLVYCDFLEHLLLHVLICKYPSKNKVPGYDVGIGGVVTLIVPELNDVYSGWITNQDWRKCTHDKVINDKAVYLAILKMFIDFVKDTRGIVKPVLHSSLNANLGLWDISKNTKLYKEIDALWN